MIEGKCPKCGDQYYGWALIEPKHQSCLKCGVGLLITEDGKKTFQGYSPFTAEEYKIKLPPGAIPDPKKIEDTKE